MKKLCLFIAFVFAASMAHAATVYLKNGSTVVGSIAERSGDKVKVDVNGVTVTYYNDEIDRVDDGGSSSIGGRPAVPAAAPSFAALGGSAAAGTVAVSPEKRDLILRFVTAFGTKEAMRANFDQMAKSLPADKAEVFRKAFNVDEILDLLLPVYAKYFSDDELNAYIAFYSSPAGEKLTKSLPYVMQESVDVSMKYFEGRMPAELKDLGKPGAESAQAPAAAK